MKQMFLSHVGFKISSVINLLHTSEVPSLLTHWSGGLVFNTGHTEHSPAQQGRSDPETET